MVPTIRFEPNEHRYFEEPTGVEIPGVTRALEEGRFIDFSMVPPHILEPAKERGTRVHTAIHYWLDGDLDAESINEETHGYVMAAAAFVNRCRITPTLVERFVHSTTHRFAGRVDLEALAERSTPGHDLVVIDWKSGLVQPSHELQLTAYVSTRPDPRAYRRMTVELHADGTFKVYEYKIDDYLRALNVFHSAVVGWHWKKEHGMLKGQRATYSWAI